MVQYTKATQQYKNQSTGQKISLQLDSTTSSGFGVTNSK